MQQRRFFNRKKVKGDLTTLPHILDGAVSGTHPQLYWTLQFLDPGLLSLTLWGIVLSYIRTHCLRIYKFLLCSFTVSLCWGIYVFAKRFWE